MTLREFLLSEHWKENEAGSWWCQTTSEYMTRETFVWLEKQLKQETK